MTNGVFQEEEFDITRGTAYHDFFGSGSENQINGSGYWTFHENSLFESFLGEVENGKMKDGDLKSKNIHAIKSIQPFLKSLKVVITEGDLAKVIEEYDGGEDKIWLADFRYDGQFKNNEQQGNGTFQIRACLCVSKSSFQNGNFDFQFINFFEGCDKYITFTNDGIKLFLHP